MREIKFTIGRLTAEGEQCQAEVSIDKEIMARGPEAVFSYLHLAWDPLDARIREMNGRILDAMKYEQQIPPEYRGHAALVIRRVLDLMYGRDTLKNLPAPPPVEESAKVENPKPSEGTPLDLGNEKAWETGA